MEERKVCLPTDFTWFVRRLVLGCCSVATLCWSGTILATRVTCSTSGGFLNSALASQLLERLRLRQATVGVVGLGYVGLPLAVEFARGGLNVVGIDLDARKVAALESGHSYIPDVPSSDISSLVSAGQLRATTDFAVVGDLDTVNVCVPTPLRKTKDPDMSYIVSAVEAIA